MLIDGMDLVFDRRLGDEAEIAAAHGRVRRFRLELLAGDMKVDLLPPERDGGGTLAPRRRHDARAQHQLVEMHARLEVADRQHEMIEAVDDEAHSAGAAAAAAGTRSPSRGRNTPAATMVAASAPSTRKSQAKSPVRS